LSELWGGRSAAVVKGVDKATAPENVAQYVQPEDLIVKVRSSSSNSTPRSL
jgi:hypothetical protein